MPKYTPWTWSQSHGRHYSYLLSDTGDVLSTLWAGPSADPSPGEAITTTAQRRVSRPSHASSASGAAYQNRTSYSRRPATQHTVSGASASRNYNIPVAEEAEDYDDIDDDEEEEEDDDDDEEDEDEDENDYREKDEDQDKGKAGQALPYRPGTEAQKDQHVDQTPNLQYADFPQPPRSRLAVQSLPRDVQIDIKHLDRRYIQTGPDANITETLDERFRRVAKHHHHLFFVPGRVFKMLWTEPAGLVNPGRTRGSTHFSTVWLGEQALSEIRYFVVVRNKKTFSSCIPIQTYGGKGATKPGLIMQDHGVIHSSKATPLLLPGENLTKYSIRVDLTDPATTGLVPTSRVNYGKAYAVEHNVKVRDIGMVTENHRYLIQGYYDAAMRGY